MPRTTHPALPRCPCGSGQFYKNCCAIAHLNPEAIPNPETLMRARYCAYCLGLSKFIQQTASETSQTWRKPPHYIGLQVHGIAYHL